MRKLCYFSVISRDINITYGKTLLTTQYYGVLRFSTISVTPLSHGGTHVCVHCRCEGPSSPRRRISTSFQLPDANTT